MSISEANNISGSVTEFILLGFPCHREIQILLFVIFSLIYILTLMGNTSIICAMCSSQKLHTPMYILLANFSFLEICYVSSDVAKMLANIISQTKSISYAGCLLQFYFFFFSMCAAEGYFLSSMSFDWFLVICLPLHYPTIMTYHLCARLVVSCWVGGFLSILIPAILISWVPFCGPNIVDHFSCDLGPLLALSYAPVPKTTLTCATVSSLIIFITFLYILGSCTLVLHPVLRLPAGSGRNKAFSKCASHFLVVSLFYVSVMVMYVSPGSRSHPGTQKFVTLFYCMTTPFFNPLIYSLQNKNMKDALKKVLLTGRSPPSKEISKNTEK
ncbi:LOW QUALITY PROTEIN: olfactory receptor 11G2-like [Mustela erminea]|uniref:LOW QUALITY PROTEIN: olfactory receptor 11G2-like n=1 Tax=Mustela erminea TaxID=36723 RepID=UPI001387123F|nr:LOW QUALITY PROTEIN: olfactory receptor 11G2-like [Mustela erminea]